MTLLQALISAPVLLAAGVYMVFIVATEAAAGWLHARSANAVGEWLVDALVLPLGRALALVLFALVAYPMLFGLPEAPALTAVLQAETAGLTKLVNLAFAVMLLLPLLPVIGSRRGLVLPLQAAAIAALLFSWTAAAAGRTDVSLWPGIGTVGTMLLFAGAGHMVAVQLAGRIGPALEEVVQREGVQLLLFDGLLLLMQIPALMVYTTALGKQLG